MPKSKVNNAKPVVASFLMVFILVGNTSMARIQKRVDFSGTWMINISKSEYGQAPINLLKRQLSVIQQPDSIVIKRTATGTQGGDTTTSETLYFDGRQTVTVTGTTKKVAIIVWAADDREFTEYSSYNSHRGDQPIDYKLSENYSLSDSGNTLVVGRKYEFITPGFKDYFIKAVYEKK